MKATDLRIGNLVLYQGENILTVDGVFSDEILTLENGYQSILDFDTIPLTEEWLIKFGFEKDIDIPFGDFEYVKSVREGNIENEIDAITIRISPKFEFYSGIYSQIVPSVHQLQNLYFALTGKELTLLK